MNTQVYLALARRSGKWPSLKSLGIAGKIGAGAAIGAALLAKQVLKDIVQGDSLDIPFVRMIRVQSVSHSIAFGGTKTDKQWVGDPGHQFGGWRKTTSGTGIGSYDEARSKQHDWADPWTDAGQAASEEYTRMEKRWEDIGDHVGGSDALKTAISAGAGMISGTTSFLKTNKFVNPNLPKHGTFAFTKWVDVATPQLAYGCSAQDPFPLAIFFFRRRGGPGVSGVRLPFFLVGLHKCLIKKWSLEGDMTENVELEYEDIAWCATNVWADTETYVPLSSNRYWKSKLPGGGEMGLDLFLQLVTQGLSAVAGAAASGSNETLSGD